jgi:hypothetical protein
VVLGEESYRSSYEHPGDVAKALETVCRSHTLLVVGASLAPDFEARPQLQRPLEEFLAREEGGVLALVGLGGAGKTALVCQALEEVLAGRLAPGFPGGILIWSFYDEPDAGAYLRSLAGYLSKQEPPEDWRDTRAYDAFRRACRPEERLLLVLDGLERLQVERPDNRRVHGSLESPVLRQLLLWLAQAPGAVRAVVTSRFPLADLAGEAGDPRDVPPPAAGAAPPPRPPAREAGSARFVALDLALAEADPARAGADLVRAQADLARAEALAAEALARSEDPECQYFWGSLDAHELLARLFEPRGEPGPALDHRRAAQALRARLDVPDLLIRPLLPDESPAASGPG